MIDLRRFRIGRFGFRASRSGGFGGPLEGSSFVLKGLPFLVGATVDSNLNFRQLDRYFGRERRAMRQQAGTGVRGSLALHQATDHLHRAQFVEISDQHL